MLRTRHCRCSLHLALLAALIFLLTSITHAQSEQQSYARRNSFGIIAAYSNDSSHMLLGSAEKRKLLSFGLSYSRRLYHNAVFDWQYDGELFPVALESDPVRTTSSTFTVVEPPMTFSGTNTFPTVNACLPDSGSEIFPNGDTYKWVSTCSRRWVVGQALSPVGMEWNFLTRRRLQPLLVGHGGYMYSSQPIPIDHAGSFNFIFDIGAGFEYFHSPSKSLRVEYRYHHISNHETADQNPGIDNGIVQISYVFGR